MDVDLVLGSEMNYVRLGMQLPPQGRIIAAPNLMLGMDELLRQLGSGKLGRLRIFDFVGAADSLPAVQFTRLTSRFQPGGSVEIVAAPAGAATTRPGTLVTGMGGGTIGMSGSSLPAVQTSGPAQSMHLSTLLGVPVSVRSQ